MGLVSALIKRFQRAPLPLWPCEDREKATTMNEEGRPLPADTLILDFQTPVKVKVAQSCPTLCNPMDYNSSWNSPGQNTGVGKPFPPPGDLPKPGIEPRAPTLQADSLLAEPQGKPKKTGVGSISLLQWIFQTQESNWGLLFCRWILYQLSYQGNP